MRRLVLIVLGALVAPAALPANAVDIDWVHIEDPGNACYPQHFPQGCFGGVAYDYQISKYEITNAQYAEFLNAVAEADPNALYNTNMGSSISGGITQSGSSDRLVGEAGLHAVAKAP